MKIDAAIGRLSIGLSGSSDRSCIRRVLGHERHEEREALLDHAGEIDRLVWSSDNTLHTGFPDADLESN